MLRFRSGGSVVKILSVTSPLSELLIGRTPQLWSLSTEKMFSSLPSVSGYDGSSFERYTEGCDSGMVEEGAASPSGRAAQMVYLRTITGRAPPFQTILPRTSKIGIAHSSSSYSSPCETGIPLQEMVNPKSTYPMYAVSDII
jgi:hypothetical protein